MGDFHTGEFVSESIKCPVCGNEYMTNMPDGSYCKHTAFFCVISPGSEPIFPFIRDDIQVSGRDVYDENTCTELGNRLDIDIHYLTESSGYYPSIVVLGVSA